MAKIKNINDLVDATFQVKKFFRDTKKQYNLNYEEIYILNYILKSESNEISSKEIATCSEFKPYYLTKALQKLKELNLLSKKRSVHDERTVIVFVTKEQKDKIKQLIDELEQYIEVTCFIIFYI
ncbi:SarA family transcriptional regulator [Staphylococcus warneri]